MIAAAAICPCPPLLAAELTGQADILPDLRAACETAVKLLLSAAPDVVVVVGPDEETGTWDPAGRLDLAAYAPALGLPGRPARPAVPLPLALGIGGLLLDQAGYAGPRAYQGVDGSAAPETCQRLGRDLAAAAPRVGMLAVGDGSARRSPSAPGYLDERAAPFDAAVERAVRDGDLPALAALDPVLAADLMAVGRPAWQVLAAALSAAALSAATPSAATPAASRPRTEILYSDAPLGVAYLVATLAPR